MQKRSDISAQAKPERKQAPLIPPVPLVPDPPNEEVEKTLWEKLKDMDKLISWIIVALLLAFPLTLFVDTIIYWFNQTYGDHLFYVYELESEIQLMWYVLLYVTCVIGLILARAGAGIYVFIKDQAYFNG